MSTYKILGLSYYGIMGFKENLKSELEYSGMLVKELAARSGVKKKTIDSYLATNSYSPSVETAVKIAKALGVSVEYLVTGTDSATREISIYSLPKDIQEIVLVSRRLPIKDREIILTLASLLQNR